MLFQNLIMFRKEVNIFIFWQFALLNKARNSDVFAFDLGRQEGADERRKFGLVGSPSQSRKNICFFLFD